MSCKYKEFFINEGDAGYVCNLEANLHELLSDYQYTPSLRFGGHIEYSTEITEPIEKLLEDLTNIKQFD